jgi:hypothetical protein
VPELEAGFEEDSEEADLDSAGFDSVAGFESLAEPEESELALEEDFEA